MKKIFLLLTVLFLLGCQTTVEPEVSIPLDCKSWFDGCNTCTVEQGKMGACTRKACAPEAMEEAKCLLTHEQAKMKEENELEASMDMSDDMDHIGCQEGEIVNGECVLSENKNVDMFDNQVNVKTESIELGYLAQPEESGNYPGVVMIHEWWGLNDNIKAMAEQLAEQGYVVLAVDLYKGQVAENSSKARELATYARSNPEETIATMKQASDYLRNLQVTKLASMGWCFGGQHSLLLSVNEDLDATVIYYGNLIDDKQQLSNIQTPVLGIFGSEDTGIPVDSVNQFQSNLNELGIENEIKIYDGVGHAFANPTGSNYAPEETMDAWNRTLSFLDENLKVENKLKSEASSIVEIEINGSNFKYEINGKEAPELKVKKGDLVKLEFNNVGGYHDFVIDELNVRTKAIGDGESEIVEFIADKQGTFDYYCSIGSHRARGMIGKFIVE